MNAHTKKPYIIADAHKLPFKDNSFQLVTSTQVLEHVLEPYKVINEAERVLVGGVLRDFSAFLHPFHHSDYWRFTILGLKKLLANFEILKIEVPTHVFTLFGIFIGIVIQKTLSMVWKNNTAAGRVRDFFSVIDKNIQNLEMFPEAHYFFDGFAHSYLVLAISKKEERKDELE